MTSENYESIGPVEQADLSFCIFPHLKDYVVLDTRKSLADGPQVHVFSADEVYDAAFYRSLERGFSELLHERDQPFVTLMSLSANVEAMMREQGMQAMLRALGERAPVEEPPEVAIVIFAGPLLESTHDQVRAVVARLVGPLAMQDFVTRATDMLVKLATQEREVSRRDRDEHVQRGLVEGNEGFMTLWERPKEPGE
jgi:hypothetical protein